MLLSFHPVTSQLRHHPIQHLHHPVPVGTTSLQVIFNLGFSPARPTTELACIPYSKGLYPPDGQHQTSLVFVPTCPELDHMPRRQREAGLVGGRVSRVIAQREVYNTCDRQASDLFGECPILLPSLSNSQSGRWAGYGKTHCGVVSKAIEDSVDFWRLVANEVAIVTLPTR